MVERKLGCTTNLLACMALVGFTQAMEYKFNFEILRVEYSVFKIEHHAK